jgi:hypothetical protein
MISTQMSYGAPFSTRGVNDCLQRGFVTYIGLGEGRLFFTRNANPAQAPGVRSYPQDYDYTELLHPNIVKQCILLLYKDNYS